MTAPRRELILKLNEIWHDLENADYDGKHPDILEDEIPRWRRATAEILAGPRPDIHVLDLGTGTGFVPRQLMDFLRPGDRLTCADLSTVMLETCAAGLREAGFPARLDTLKLDGQDIDLPDASVDLVTVNAVLHHIPDVPGFCREVDRVLKPGGRVLVGHEPNRVYYDHPTLIRLYWLLLPFADFKLFGYELLLRVGLFERLRRPLGRWLPELRRHNLILAAVNARLIADGDIDRPLPAAVLSSLLDVHSPTAGGTFRERGFARADFGEYFPGYGVERFETYKHLGKLHPRRRWVRAVEARLAGRHPDAGTSLFCGLRKPSTDLP
ncbi:MAG TPA: class I SAM-dependent methyltransferase [Fibrobacteria bacterium]|nr:class I SAM-dependent methyltransferase [Fibrobacteria bacterium]